MPHLQSPTATFSSTINEYHTHTSNKRNEKDTGFSFNRKSEPNNIHHTGNDASKDGGFGFGSGNSMKDTTNEVRIFYCDVPIWQPKLSTHFNRSITLLTYVPAN
jgi:hypothetical protein